MVKYSKTRYRYKKSGKRKSRLRTNYRRTKLQNKKINKYGGMTRVMQPGTYTNTVTEPHQKEKTVHLLLKQLINNKYLTEHFNEKSLYQISFSKIALMLRNPIQYFKGSPDLKVRQPSINEERRRQPSINEKRRRQQEALNRRQSQALNSRESLDRTQSVVQPIIEERQKRQSQALNSREKLEPEAQNLKRTEEERQNKMRLKRLAALNRSGGSLIGGGLTDINIKSTRIHNLLKVFDSIHDFCSDRGNLNLTKIFNAFLGDAKQVKAWEDFFKNNNINKHSIEEKLLDDAKNLMESYSEELGNKFDTLDRRADKDKFLPEEERVIDNYLSVKSHQTNPNVCQDNKHHTASEVNAVDKHKQFYVFKLGEKGDLKAGEKSYQNFIKSIKDKANEVYSGNRTILFEAGKYNEVVRHLVNNDLVGYEVPGFDPFSIIYSDASKWDSATGKKILGAQPDYNKTGNITSAINNKQDCLNILELKGLYNDNALINYNQTTDFDDKAFMVNTGAPVSELSQIKTLDNVNNLYFFKNVFNIETNIIDKIPVKLESFSSKEKPHEGLCNSLIMKRSGDWGQVEFCLKYNIVLFTFDRLCALYAIYRNCPCIFESFTGTSYYITLFTGKPDKKKGCVDIIESIYQIDNIYKDIYNKLDTLGIDIGMSETYSGHTDKVTDITKEINSSNDNKKDIIIEINLKSEDYIDKILKPLQGIKSSQYNIFYDRINIDNKLFVQSTKTLTSLFETESRPGGLEPSLLDEIMKTYLNVKYSNTIDTSNKGKTNSSIKILNKLIELNNEDDINKKSSYKLELLDFLTNLKKSYDTKLNNFISTTSGTYGCKKRELLLLLLMTDDDKTNYNKITQNYINRKSLVYKPPKKEYKLLPYLYPFPKGDDKKIISINDTGGTLNIDFNYHDMETAFVKDMQRDLSRLYFYLFDTQRYELIEWKKTDHDGQLEKKDELESKFLKLLKIIREIESLLSLSLPKTPDTLEPNKIDGSALLSNKDINLDLRSKTVIDSINRLKDKQSKTCEIENLLKHFYHIFYSTSNYSTIYPKEITKEHTGKKLSEIKESYNFCDKLNKLTKKGGFQKGGEINQDKITEDGKRCLDIVTIPILKSLIEFHHINLVKGKKISISSKSVAQLKEMINKSNISDQDIMDFFPDDTNGLKSIKQNSSQIKECRTHKKNMVSNTPDRKEQKTLSTKKSNPRKKSKKPLEGRSSCVDMTVPEEPWIYEPTSKIEFGHIFTPYGMLFGIQEQLVNKKCDDDYLVYVKETFYNYILNRYPDYKIPIDYSVNNNLNEIYDLTLITYQLCVNIIHGLKDTELITNHFNDLIDTYKLLLEETMWVSGEDILSSIEHSFTKQGKGPTIVHNDFQLLYEFIFEFLLYNKIENIDKSSSTDGSDLNIINRLFVDWDIKLPKSIIYNDKFYSLLNSYIWVIIKQKPQAYASDYLKIIVSGQTNKLSDVIDSTADKENYISNFENIFIILLTNINQLRKQYKGQNLVNISSEVAYFSYKQNEGDPLIVNDDFKKQLVKMFLLERDNEVDTERFYNYMLRPYKPNDESLLSEIISSCIDESDHRSNIIVLFNQLDNLFRINDSVKDLSFTINMKMNSTKSNLNQYISDINTAITSINNLISNLNGAVKTSFEIFRDDYILEFRDSLVKYEISNYLIDNIDVVEPSDDEDILIKKLNQLNNLYVPSDNIDITLKNSNGEYIFLTKMFAEE